MANHLRPVPRAYLIDGYISFTFGFQTAEHYMARIFKLDPRSSQLLRMAPSTSLIILRIIINLLIWYMDKTPGLLIILPLAGQRGPVVPQQIWLPQGEGERKTFVEDAQFRVLAFFVNMDWSQAYPSRTPGICNCVTDIWRSQCPTIPH